VSRAAGRWEGMWRVSRGGPQKKERSGARRLGRCCPVPDRDLFPVELSGNVHLNAWVFAEVSDRES